MTTFTKISDLPVTTTLSDNDKFIIETATGTKACSRSVLREETTITKEDIGLGNVDNTSDLDKPISTAVQTALGSYTPTSTLASTYLTQSSAGSIYVTQTSASGTYLSKTDAATYYETKENAGSVYATKTEATNNITTNTFTVLTTTTKTVTGAINELNGIVAGVETLLSQI
jgi:hypothetical protein